MHGSECRASEFRVWGLRTQPKRTNLKDKQLKVFDWLVECHVLRATVSRMRPTISSSCVLAAIHPEVPFK